MKIRSREQMVGIDYYGIMLLHYPYYYAWKHLQRKSDFGFPKSEKGYQMIAKQMAARIAQNVGCDAKKAELLCMGIGACFPKHGMAGLNYIKAYIAEKGLAIDIDTLEIECIEESVGDFAKYVPIDFDEALRAYYGGSEDIPEVNIVRLCQKTIRDIKRVEKHDPAAGGGDLLFSVTEEIISDSKLTGEVRESEKLKQMLVGIPEACEVLPDEEKQIMCGRLDTYLERFGLEGICKYICTVG